nr:unnamed protein product [Spirometra erinaceieuropaei]
MSDIVSLPADKERSTVVMDKTDYTMKLQSLLEDEGAYELLETGEFKKHLNSVNRAIDKLWKAGVLKRKEALAAKATDEPRRVSTACQKCIKQESPYKTIVSLRGTPTLGLSKWLYLRFRFLTEDSEWTVKSAERLVFRSYSPKLWARYVDDTSVVIKRNGVQDFKVLLNSIFPDIQFTMEEENNNQLSVVDVNVARTASGRIRTAVPVYMDTAPAETEFRSHSASNAVETAGPVLDSILILTAIVEMGLEDLKDAKSSGPDNIPAKFLKELANELPKLLVHIFCSSFELGRLPSEWKIANIFLIYKVGARTNPNNYRPLSLTCISCKIMEAIVKKATMNFLEQNHLLSDLQHGFRQKRSCLSSLLPSTEQWTRALDEDGRVDGIYTDFKKAFDSVPRKRLIYKLSEIGIRRRLLTWITDFLTGRSQTVCVEASRSTPTPVLSGVLQGSVLGPLLFLVYINDCVDDLGCSAIMFADDVKLWRAITSDADRPLRGRIVRGREFALDFDDFFESAGTDRPRGHPFKLQKELAHSDVRRNAFSHRTQQATWSKLKFGDRTAKNLADVPYIDGVSEAVSHLLRPLGIDTAYRTESTVRNLVMRPKTSLPPRETTNVTYRI